jgi:hypothetical protein
VDSVHKAVDRAGPVHRGPVAIAACPRSSKLGLQPLRWLGLSDEGRRRETGARGCRFRAHRGSKAAEQWRVGGEGGGRESFGAGHSGLKNGARWSGGGAMGGGDAGVPFYWVGGGVGWPGIGGE